MCSSRLVSCSPDPGFALFAFQPVVLITKTLVLFPQRAGLCHQLFDQVQKMDDRLACAFEVLNVVRINVF